MRVLVALLWTLGTVTARELSITDYGAVPGRANNATAAFENGKALYDAMRAARKGDVVVVPAGQRFVMVPYAPLYRLEHVELRLWRRRGSGPCGSTPRSPSTWAG